MDAKPQCPRDEFTRERMQKIAHLVDEELPQGWGFIVLAFPFGDNEGRLNYVSNASRDDCKKLIQEWLDKGGLKPGHHA